MAKGGYFRSLTVPGELVGKAVTLERYGALVMQPWTLRAYKLRQLFLETQDSPEGMASFKVEDEELQRMADDVAGAIRTIDGERVEGLTGDDLLAECEAFEIAACWSQFHMACRATDLEKKA